MSSSSSPPSSGKPGLTWGKVMESWQREKEKERIRRMAEEAAPRKAMRVTKVDPARGTITLNFPGKEAEEIMRSSKNGNPAPRPKITRVILWQDSTRKWAVVEGPFPLGLYRSETRDTVEKAAKLSVGYMCARPQTTAPKVYAKVLRADVVEVFSGENEWGKVCP